MQAPHVQPLKSVMTTLCSHQLRNWPCNTSTRHHQNHIPETREAAQRPLPAPEPQPRNLLIRAMLHLTRHPDALHRHRSQILQIRTSKTCSWRVVLVSHADAAQLRCELRCEVLTCRPGVSRTSRCRLQVQNAMITPSDYQTSGGLSGDQMVKNVLTEASHAGLNVARTWCAVRRALAIARWCLQAPPADQCRVMWTTMAPGCQHSPCRAVMTVITVLQTVLRTPVQRRGSR